MLKNTVAISLLVALVAPGVASAQSGFSLTLTPSVPPSKPQLPAPSRRLAMPVLDYVAPNGSIVLRRGLVAGVDVAPNATFGLGIFEGAPKRRIGAVDPAEPERRSKRAAVGLSLIF